MSTPTVVALVSALQKAEQFIAGFEDDATQRHVVAPLLAEIRVAAVLIPPPVAEATFIHTPRPAHVCTGEHDHQRRFGNFENDYLPRPVISCGEAHGAELTVYRDGKSNAAELELKLGLYTNASFDFRMTPAELRETAARLLDAAHDIEAHPAAQLARGREAAAA